MLEPRGKGIVATALRFASRGARRRGHHFDEIPDGEGPARHAHARRAYPRHQKKADFDPDKFEDRYETALDRADQRQARPASKPQTAPAAQAEQCDQSHGCAAPQREGREGRREAAPRQYWAGEAAPKQRASFRQGSRTKKAKKKRRVQPGRQAQRGS